MHMVTNIEKNLRKKHAESQSELEILRIKYGNLKVNYRSMDMQSGLLGLTNNPHRFNRLHDSNKLSPAPYRQSQGCDSEVNIGGMN